METWIPVLCCSSLPTAAQIQQILVSELQTVLKWNLVRCCPYLDSWEGARKSRILAGIYSWSGLWSCCAVARTRLLRTCVKCWPSSSLLSSSSSSSECPIFHQWRGGILFRGFLSSAADNSEQFSVECWKKFSFPLVLLFFTPWLADKTHATFSTNGKQNQSYAHAFSRAWGLLHVIASNPDWLIALFMSVVIGQSNCFVFDFTTLNWRLHPSAILITALILFALTVQFQPLEPCQERKWVLTAVTQ